MRKMIKKILILLVIFILALAGYFAWSSMKQSDERALYTAIEDADLPVAHMEVFGMRMNRLSGFVEDKPGSAGRGDLTVLPQDRRLSVVFEDVDSPVKGIQYEIRSLDGERLVERTTLTEWTQEDGQVRAQLDIQNLLTADEEYRMTLAIATEEHPAVFFYTRVVWTEQPQIKDMIDLAVSFSEKTFDRSAARELTTYLETDPNADNSSLGQITLKNSFSQLTWRDLPMERVGEVSIHLKEMQGLMGSVELEYVAAETKADGTREFYDVTECFTMKQGIQRIYMMDYERRVNQIFEGRDEQFGDSRLMLGISDGEDLQAVSDTSGRYRVFVANRALWSYDTEEGESTKVFSFRKSEEDLRSNDNTHGIRILSVSETGTIDFMVYGYMNRGNHEGTTGAALYRYETASNALTERLYLPVDTDYDRMRQDISRLCYLSGNETLYILMNHAVYGVDLAGKEYVVVADGLTEENFAVSTSGSRIAWQEGGDIYNCRKLNVMDLENGKKDEITFADETVVRLVGFVGSDLVYGLAHPGQQIVTDGRVTGLPLYAIEIVGNDMTTETRYEKPGVYLMDVEIQDSRVHLTRMREGAFGYEPMDEDTLVCNEEVASDSLTGIGYAAFEDRGRQYFLQLESGHAGANNIRVRVPKRAVAEENNEISLRENKPLDMRVYFAYSRGRMNGVFADFSSAVQAAYDGMGIVTDNEGRVFWTRAGRSDTKTIRDVQGEVPMVERYLAELAEGKETSSDGTALVDARGLTLNQVLYFVYRDKPVAAYLGDGSYVLLYGYDPYNVSCLWYPGTDGAYTNKMGLNDAAAFFEANGGNDFICFLPVGEGR